MTILTKVLNKQSMKSRKHKTLIMRRLNQKVEIKQTKTLNGLYVETEVQVWDKTMNKQKMET